MVPRELMKQIRRIQIRTSHLADDILSGEYHSAFKGRGIEFEEVRPYQVGDDVRSIDWNVTARHGEPYIKLFREEREMTVVLLVDQSHSQNLGTHHLTKRQLVAELGATLAFSAIKNNDRVGLQLFTDEIEKVLPPGKGSRHVLRLIRELLYCEPVGRGTNLAKALEHLYQSVKRRSVVFLISDFQDAGYEKMLRIAARKHDIIPIVISDPRERTLPNVGLIELLDEETGRSVSIDTSSRVHRNLYEDLASASIQSRNQLFKRLRLDSIAIETGEDFVNPLHRFFHAREVRGGHR